MIDAIMNKPEPWEIALTYKNVPFLHMGRTRQGIDCVGLLILTAREYGLIPEDNLLYGREPSVHNNAFDLAHYIRRNTGSDPVDRPVQPNDVLLLRFKSHMAPSHLGLAAPHPNGIGIIHTYGEIGRVVFQRIDDRRMDMIVGVYPWPT